MIRPARPEDAVATAVIYNQGIAERQATFQTRVHEPGEMEAKLAERDGVLLVAVQGEAIAEALIGQIYMVTVVALIVTNIGRGRPRTRS